MKVVPGGQQTLLASLFHEHADRLRGMLWGVLRNRDAVEDVVQTTFAKALESSGEVRSVSWKAWLFQVAYNEAMLLRRKEGVRQRAFQKISAGQQPPGDAWPGDGLAARELVDQVGRLLAELPPEQREVVRRRMHQEQTFAEIAADLGVPLGTVLTRMRLATDKLRKALQRTDSHHGGGEERSGEQR
ncbi:RNA polymerase sigma factor [Caulifigura coniformis]|uniref:RNA polymerase sigma factor n=1 Tax=Caulifigura coniformis TaxID=2527983 RepID=UPI0018D261F3|nr:RNA polymerase sigma factor [Caulifigura coniformis]